MASAGGKPGWLARLLQHAIPPANPGFEHLYDQVTAWHVEIDSKSGEPLREVGLNDKQEVVVVGPWGDNLGMIVDCRGKFVATDCQQISREQFEREWKSFDPKRSGGR
jgi:hypothetical protein